mmetsp:Transcript_29208/g.43057  ORF Transcript_29208/g.43057 Transcript_29208/m.43057 type:complete len:821 (+) Transcript_29208:127-2589(+)
MAYSSPFLLWAVLFSIAMVQEHSVVHGFILPTTNTVPPTISKRLFTNEETRKIIHHSIISPTINPHKTQTTATRNSKTALHGIPKMFRWLTDQYPNINRRLSEGLTSDVQVDNFYLDMNGIIHPCTHGNADDKIVVLDETAMFKKIFGYVDRLYKIVKPRKLLYLAVDGVAPRAKMNQQRSRRFRSSKEAEELAATILARDGELPEGTKFDSNCITPGTDFMLKLSLAMQKWIEYKQKTDPFWMNGADVVFSGPDVPGEGEHKVMDYLREVKDEYYSSKDETTNGEGGNDDAKNPHYAPGLTHVLYGLDADLIMLGLVTHEPNFMLLREKMSVVMAGRGRNKNRKKKDMLEYTRDDFELLELKALRQMFQIQFRKFADRDILKVPYDSSRIIDDFVFMCMMVGNDFLPHCPHLEIDNGALSLMLSTYIDLLPEWGGYLTDKEKIHPQRFEQFVYHLAAYEEEHFKRRSYEENEPGWALSSEHETEATDFYGVHYGGEPTPNAAQAANGPNDNKNQKKNSMVNGNVLEGEDILDTATSIPSQIKTEKKFHKKHPTDASRSYRDFYYEAKHGLTPLKSHRDETLFARRAIVRDYLEGLHWVLAYYHRGCRSWDWYFPHLYSCLGTDMVNLNEFYEGCQEDEGDNDEGFRAFKFEDTEPFPSLAQLLSVLPPQSATLLPGALAELMLEPSSPIADYYPRDFTTDANGKRQPWEAVVQIPFIDGDTLLETVNSILDGDEKSPDDKKLLSNAERRRNVKGKSMTFVPPAGGAAAGGATNQNMVDESIMGTGGGRGGGRRGGGGGRRMPERGGRRPASRPGSRRSN